MSDKPFDGNPAPIDDLQRAFGEAIHGAFLAEALTVLLVEKRLLSRTELELALDHVLLFIEGLRGGHSPDAAAIDYARGRLESLIKKLRAGSVPPR